MIRILAAGESEADALLSELKEWVYNPATIAQKTWRAVRYASEVDVDFVRKSVKAIGQTAIKLEAAAERCVNVLLDLISTRVSYVVQEAVVVMKAKTFFPRDSRVLLSYHSFFRIFSANTPQHMKVLSQRYVPIWTSSMNQKPKLLSFG